MIAGSCWPVGIVVEMGASFAVAFVVAFACSVV
jgi:hypothetical protein